MAGSTKKAAAKGVGGTKAPKRAPRRGGAAAAAAGAAGIGDLSDELLARIFAVVPKVERERQFIFSAVRAAAPARSLTGRHALARVSRRWHSAVAAAAAAGAMWEELELDCCAAAFPKHETGLRSWLAAHAGGVRRLTLYVASRAEWPAGRVVLEAAAPPRARPLRR
jgi:hypothetical protein